MHCSCQLINLQVNKKENYVIIYLFRSTNMNSFANVPIIHSTFCYLSRLVLFMELRYHVVIIEN